MELSLRGLESTEKLAVHPDAGVILLLTAISLWIVEGYMEQTKTSVVCKMVEPGKLHIAKVLPGAVWLTLALAAVVLIYVNPFRETEVDDDWAYALTVRHLLDSGQYHLQDSATANMPFQAYWGALFADIGGYSHGNLRLSTLVLWASGLAAFYFLCREHGLGRREAGLLTLGLYSCP